MTPAAGTHRSPGSRTIKSRHAQIADLCKKNHSSRKTEESAREREREEPNFYSTSIILQVQNNSPNLEGKQFTFRHIHYSQSFFTATPESLAIFRGEKNSHVAIFTTRNPSLLQFQILSPNLEGEKVTFSPYSLLTILIYCESGLSRHI
jgi:hypothetical protein